MTNIMHIRRQQMLREAEGSLDLAMACADMTMPIAKARDVNISLFIAYSLH